MFETPVKLDQTMVDKKPIFVWHTITPCLADVQVKFEAGPNHVQKSDACMNACIGTCSDANMNASMHA